MLELYVLCTLAAMGYFLNMNSKIQPKRKEISKFESPSTTSIYNSEFTKTVDKIEKHAAEKAYEEALKPNSKRIMSLTGEYIDPSQFRHQNMTPYFGGSVRQNMDANTNRAILETFTGVTDKNINPKTKCEVKSFYDQARDFGNVYGMANNDAFYRDRYEQPKIRNNEMPVAQVRVGPGLNRGYTAEPSGGFQQFDAQDYAQEKCVDELRVKSKPKTTFEARTVDGLKGSLPGEPGKVAKNRVERFYEQTPDMYLRTTGANLKATQVPKFNVKATNRLHTSKQFMGPARGKDQQYDLQKDTIKKSSKQQLKAAGIRNAVLSAFGLGQKDDHGKGNIVVYKNERDLTTTRTYQGNITSLVKSITAPIEDLIKNTKKQETVNNPRTYGNMKPAAPAHITIVDTTDIARTTIKETLIHDEQTGLNLAGPKEIYVHDPEEVAKTTGRETLADVEYHGNLGSSFKRATLPLDDDIRTTTKETTIDQLYTGQAEALEGGLGYITNEHEAPATQKQFLSDRDYIGQAGHDRGEGYITNEHEAPATQKQFLSDNDHFGIAEGSHKKEMSHANYEAANISAKHESLLFNRKPTATGAKKQNTNVNMRIVKPDAQQIREFNNLERVYQTPTTQNSQITKQPLAVEINPSIGFDRIDPDLLKAYRENPYTQSLQSTL